MSNPDKRASATQERSEENENSNPTFADKVNDAVKAMTKDSKGNYVLPSDLPEEVAYAATLEKRRRDTQAAYTQTAQESKALKAEKAALLNKLQGSVEVKLTPEQTEELEELKFSDPEAWRKKMNLLEGQARTARLKEIDEELKQVSTGSLETEELEQRKQTLLDFNASHDDIEITQELIDNDIPPRLLKKLETGSVSFEGFLQECYEYVKKGKVVKQEEIQDQPNLSKVGGGNRPDKNAMNEDITRSYEKEIY